MKYYSSIKIPFPTSFCYEWHQSLQTPMVITRTTKFKTKHIRKLSPSLLLLACSLCHFFCISNSWILYWRTFSIFTHTIRFLCILANGFKSNHHRDIASEEIYNRHLFIVDSRRLQSVKVDVRSSVTSSASGHTSQSFTKIRPVGVAVMNA